MSSSFIHVDVVWPETEAQAYLAHFYLVFAGSTFAQTLKCLGRRTRLDELPAKSLGHGGLGGFSECFGVSHLELRPSTTERTPELCGKQRDLNKTVREVTEAGHTEREIERGLSSPGIKRGWDVLCCDTVPCRDLISGFFSGTAVIAEMWLNPAKAPAGTNRNGIIRCRPDIPSEDPETMQKSFQGLRGRAVG